METLAVHAQMLCWPLHTGDRTEEEAKTNQPAVGSKFILWAQETFTNTACGYEPFPPEDTNERKCLSRIIEVEHMLGGWFPQKHCA